MVRKWRGFTIIELVVVITVIAILTAIVTFGFMQQQVRSRDAERATSARLIAEALEKYYDKKGEYPPCPAMTDTATNLSANTLPGIDTSVLLAPRDTTAGASNSIKCTDLTSSSQPDFFAYVGDGSTNCQSGSACLSFTIKYKIEAQNQIGVIASRRSTNISTSGTPTLTATATGFTSANLSWTSVSNSISYTLQRSTDSAFTQNLVSTNYVGINASLTGLSYNTTYYFRVRANASGGTFGNWSSAKTLSTWAVGTPSVTASTVSSTSFREAWSATSNATGYTVQCSSNGTTWGSGCQTTTTATSFTFTGASQGTRYYVRAQATNGSFTSDWSNIASTITTIDAPPAYNMNTIQAWDAAHFNYLRGSANLASCPAGTTPVYHWYHNVNGSNTFWVGGSQYQVVDHTLGWGSTVTLTVATRCETALTYSGWTWASTSASMTLTGPSAAAFLPAYRTAGWGGSCPNYTTDYNYYWRVWGDGTVGNTGVQGPTKATSWNGTAYTWGDGNIRATLQCYGPWGTVSADGMGMFGGGCTPTITKAICTY